MRRTILTGLERKPSVANCRTIQPEHTSYHFRRIDFEEWLSSCPDGVKSSTATMLYAFKSYWIERKFALSRGI
jgi:hypothetical protein